MALLGYKVLLIDGDMQLNLSLSFFEEEKVLEMAKGEKNLYTAMKNQQDLQDFIVPTGYENLDIIPSSTLMSSIEYELFAKWQREFILKKALKSIKASEGYDFILIDNAPADHILTVNSMFASDYILIPLRIENYSYKGLCETLNSLSYIIEEHELQNLTFLGAFFTQVNPRTNIFKEMTGQCKTNFSLAGFHGKLFHTYIRSDTKINEINASFDSLLHYPESNALIDYANLLLETGLLDPKSSQILKEAIS